jgi:hypothetical protein
MGILGSATNRSFASLQDTKNPWGLKRPNRPRKLRVCVPQKSVENVNALIFRVFGWHALRLCEGCGASQDHALRSSGRATKPRKLWIHGLRLLCRHGKPSPNGTPANPQGQGIRGRLGLSFSNSSRCKLVAEVVRLRTVFHGCTPNSHDFGYEGPAEFGTTDFTLSGRRG